MAQWAEPLPDGIYLDLSAPDYFAQETRGSSDWVKLRRQRWGWWWSSPYNPDRKDVQTAEQLYGSALHAILLESVGAYEARFAVTPDPLAYGRELCRTIDDMKRALVQAGFGKWPDGWLKADFERACRVNIPRVPVWGNILNDFVGRLGPGVQAVSAAEDRQLRFMREVAVGDWPGNEAIRKLLLAAPDRPPMAEVSVLCTVDGIRRRWRFDRMFPAFDLDLKSLGNWTGRPLPYAVGDQLARLGWHIQRADYWEGRRLAYAMIKAYGMACVCGGTLEQRRWLVSWPDAFPVWDWVWLAYQKPAESGRAPVIFPIWDDSFAGPERPSALRAIGRHQLNDAIAFYREAVATFGLERPWAHVEEIHYADPGISPCITLPHWIGEDTPTEEGAYQ
jgi:hypothetical protein